MSTDSKPAPDTEDQLDALADVIDDLQLIADSDARYATYASEWLERLEEAGYDV